MLADPAIEKTRLHDMNQKPLLLVRSKEKLNEREQWLQNQAEVFWEDQYITLSRLPLSVFRNAHKQWKEIALEKMSTLTNHGAFSSDTNSNSIIFEGFESNEKAPHIFSGESSFYSRKGQKVLLDQKLDSTFPKGDYELSFWLYVDSRKYDMPRAEIKVFDSSGKQLSLTKMNSRQVYDVYNGWIRVADKVHLKAGDTLQLLIKDEYVSVDDLLVKPVDSHVFVETSDMKLFNNYPL